MKEIRVASAKNHAAKFNFPFAPIAVFILSIVLAQTQLFPFTYPLGIAFVSAVSSLKSLLPIFLGSVVGSLFIPSFGGYYSLLLALTFAARVALNLYLDKSKITTALTAGTTDDKPKSTMSLVKNASLDENIRLRMMLSSAAALVSGIWNTVLGDFSYYYLFGAVFSTLTTPLVTYLAYSATEKRLRSSVVGEIGVFFIMGVTAYSLSHTVNAPLDCGIAFSAIMTILITAKFGAYRGITTAVSCGMAISPSVIPNLAIAAATTAFVGKTSTPLSLSIITAATSAYSVLTNGLNGFVEFFPPIVSACLLTAPVLGMKINVISDKLFGASLVKNLAVTEVAQRSGEEYRGRVSSFAGSLVRSSAVMNGVAEKLRRPRDTELDEIVEDTVSRYCGLCKNREKCTARNEIRHGMSEKLRSVGEVGAGDVSAKTASFCYNVGRMIDDINSVVSLRVRGMREGDFLTVAAEDMAAVGELLCTMDKSLCDEFRENREESARLAKLLSYNNFHATGVKVYGDRHRRVYIGDIDLSSTRLGGDDIRRLITEILGGEFTQPEFSLDGAVLSMRIESARQLKTRSGTYTMSAGGIERYCHKMAKEAVCERTITISDEPPETVSGDSIVTFESMGRQYMVISDGMGSGREAAVMSGMAVTLLREYIEGGAELESALKLLNRILRDVGRECSATMDICEVDLYTGEARFIKSGAAPSFVLRGGSIYRLQSKTVPIGIIRALDAEMIKFDIERGDTIVMLSDGAARSYDEVPWLLDMMVTDDVILHGGEREAAMAIVSEAAVRGSRDDITCGVMRVG